MSPVRSPESGLCVPTSPYCDSAPWVGSSRHVGARSRRGRLLFPMCDSAPRERYTGDPSKSALGASTQEKGYRTPSRRQGLCSLPIPRGSVAIWEAAFGV